MRPALLTAAVVFGASMNPAGAAVLSSAIVSAALAKRAVHGIRKTIVSAVDDPLGV
jgi:hypothetical protein